MFEIGNEHLADAASEIPSLWCLSVSLEDVRRMLTPAAGHRAVPLMISLTERFGAIKVRDSSKAVLLLSTELTDTVAWRNLLSLRLKLNGWTA